MLPADTIAEITTNLAALQLEPSTAAQILAAVFAPLLRTEQAAKPVSVRDEFPVPWRRPRLRTRKALRTKNALRPNQRRRQRSREAHDRALAALKVHPGETVSATARAAGCSRTTVIDARAELAREARKAARRKAKPAPTTRNAEKAERRERAQKFLRDALARGPKTVSDIEAAAAKTHVDEVLLTQARADLHVVTSRGNAGGVQAVQWSLPG